MEMVGIQEESRAVTCGGCGRLFGCGVETGACWCRDFEIDGVLLEKISMEFEDCLCPDCLQRMSQSPSKSPASEPESDCDSKNQE